MPSADAQAIRSSAGQNGSDFFEVSKHIGEKVYGEDNWRQLNRQL